MCALVIGVQTCALPILAHLSCRLCDDGSLRRSGLAAAGGAAADRCRRLPLFGGRQRLLPFLPLRLLPAVLTPAVEIGLELLLALPAVFVIVAVQLLDLPVAPAAIMRSEEHTSELQSLMRISYAVFCW